jgi:hypothetical protein
MPPSGAEPAPASVAPALVELAVDPTVEPAPVDALVLPLPVALDSLPIVDPDEAPVVVDGAPGPGGDPPELAHAKANTTGMVKNPGKRRRIRALAEGGIESGILTENAP